MVADEFQRAGLVEVLDREDGLEDALQPGVLAVLRGLVCLQELVVAVLLDIDQVGDVDDLLDFCEVLADSEVVLDRGRHVASAPKVKTSRTSQRSENSGTGGGRLDPRRAGQIRKARRPT